MEQARFDSLMRQSRKKVYNLAYRLSMNSQDAEDLTQEAYFRAYRNFEDYQGDRPFENWIFRIVTRLFLDLKRNRKRRIQTVSSDAPFKSERADDGIVIDAADKAPTAEELIVQNTLSEPLLNALEALQPDQRELIWLADIEKIPYQDIADQVGVPVGTVRSRLHRAHRRLRSALNF